MFRRTAVHFLVFSQPQVTNPGKPHFFWSIFPRQKRNHVPSVSKATTSASPSASNTASSVDSATGCAMNSPGCGMRLVGGPGGWRRLEEAGKTSRVKVYKHSRPFVWKLLRNKITRTKKPVHFVVLVGKSVGCSFQPTENQIQFVLRADLWGLIFRLYGFHEAQSLPHGHLLEAELGLLWWFFKSLGPFLGVFW